MRKLVIWRVVFIPFFFNGAKSHKVIVLWLWQCTLIFCHVTILCMLYHDILVISFYFHFSYARVQKSSNSLCLQIRSSADQFVFVVYAVDLCRIVFYKTLQYVCDIASVTLSYVQYLMAAITQRVWKLQQFVTPSSCDYLYFFVIINTLIVTLDCFSIECISKERFVHKSCLTGRA